MTSEEVFKKFVPPAAADYCNRLYEELGFEFKITKSRNTKLGDYRFNRELKKSTITVNNDLNAYAFLVTYLHEVAHHITFSKFSRRVNPHGKEWKKEFIRVSEPVLQESVFPPLVLKALNSYFENPKASSCADPKLYLALRAFDDPSDKISLDKVQLDQSFQFNKRTFVKLEKKRTRWVCEEATSKRKYLISGIAEVRILDNKA